MLRVPTRNLRARRQNLLPRPDVTVRVALESASLRKLFVVIVLAITVSGCALVYTGSVTTGDNQKAVAASKLLEAEYVKEGFQPNDVAADSKAYYWSSWFTSPESTRYNAIWIGNWVKDGTLFIRIVPQPGCNDALRAFGGHMQIFMTNAFPCFDWRLVGRQEPDLLR